MKKVFVMTSGALIFLLLVAPAFAGTVNEIILGSSLGAPIKFIGTGGGNFHATFNIVSLNASGFGSLASSGFYSIVNNGAVVSWAGNSASCNASAGCFNLGQTGPLKFTYGSTAGASDLLTGDLAVLDFTQSALSTGIFNNEIVIGLTNLGGSLAGAFSSGNGAVQLTIKFTTSASLANIGTKQLLAKVTSGAVFPVPEPTSLALLSASLIGLSVLGRRAKLLA